MSKALINGGRFKISEKFKDVTYGQLYMAFDKRDEDVSKLKFFIMTNMSYEIHLNILGNTVMRNNF